METEENEYTLGSIVKLTWKNIILIIIIFYIIGDIMLGIRMFINKQIKSYQETQRQIRWEQYEKEHPLPKF